MIDNQLSIHKQQNIHQHTDHSSKQCTWATLAYLSIVTVYIYISFVHSFVILNVKMNCDQYVFAAWTVLNFVSVS